MDRLHIVEHVEVVAFEKYDFGFRKFAAFACTVNIPTNRCEGSYFFKCFENCKVAHIAKVQDVLDACECGDNLMSQQTVVSLTTPMIICRN